MAAPGPARLSLVAVGLALAGAVGLMGLVMRLVIALAE
jgi:hypothetical protein